MKGQMYQGELIHARINLESQEISIMSIKYIPTVSVWEINQAQRMQRALSDAIDREDDQFVVTIRDSMPILLHKEEMHQLQRELKEMIDLLLRHQ